MWCKKCNKSRSRKTVVVFATRPDRFWCPKCNWLLLEKKPVSDDKPDVVAGGYSDDCAYITGVEDSEYDVPEVEYPLFLGNKEVGTIRVHWSSGYSGGWEVEIRGTGGKAFSVRPTGKEVEKEE